MTNETQTGGQAFPGGTAFSSPGMTLRDWFAGQALAGLIAADTNLASTAESLADFAYDQADAMLAARDDA